MRLMHPEHGWHVASAADDIEGMRRAGWVDDDGKALAAKLAKKPLAHVVGPEREKADAEAWAAAEAAGAARLAEQEAAREQEAEAPAVDPRDAVRAELDALGIKWDARWGLKKLIAAKG